MWFQMHGGLPSQRGQQGRRHRRARVDRRYDLGTASALHGRRSRRSPISKRVSTRQNEGWTHIGYLGPRQQLLYGYLSLFAVFSVCRGVGLGLGWDRGMGAIGHRRGRGRGGRRRGCHCGGGKG